MGFWKQTDYYSLGASDGRKAAFQQTSNLLMTEESVREAAALAATALPGRPLPVDAKRYQAGWIEGYSSTRDKVRR